MRIFLENCLNDSNLESNLNVHFQQDEAQRTFFSDSRYIGTNAPIQWPPRFT